MCTLLHRDGHLANSNAQPQELICSPLQEKARPQKARKGMNKREKQW